MCIYTSIDLSFKDVCYYFPIASNVRYCKISSFKDNNRNLTCICILRIQNIKIPFSSALPDGYNINDYNSLVYMYSMSFEKWHLQKFLIHTDGVCYQSTTNDFDIALTNTKLLRFLRNLSISPIIYISC